MSALEVAASAFGLAFLFAAGALICGWLNPVSTPERDSLYEHYEDLDPFDHSER